jgi:hypothetical protein
MHSFCFGESNDEKVGANANKVTKNVMLQSAILLAQPFASPLIYQV